MRSAAPFVGSPDALTASIASLEARIDQRHQGIHRLATSCRQQIKARVTSWPALMAACMSGFLLGVHIHQPRTTPAADSNNLPSRKANAALKLATRAFTIVKHLPW